MEDRDRIGCRPLHTVPPYAARMHLPRTAALVELDVRERVGSTNDELRARADAPDYAVVATGEQTAGRGRLGRVWVAPPGQTLAASTLVRPRDAAGSPLAPDALRWVPLAAGVALTHAVRAVLPDVDVTLKWPNDVHVEGRKACGVLVELLAGADGAIVGTGVNLAIPADALPTPTSTSLGLHAPRDASGAPLADDALADAVLVGYLEALRALVDALGAAGGDGSASGLRDAVVAVCSTLGRDVRVELPGDRVLAGAAVGIDADGALEVREAQTGRVVAVTVGDVTHVRHDRGDAATP